MRNKPMQYSGKDITDSVIEKIKNITKSGYNNTIYLDYFSSINNIEDLCNTHGTNIEEEYVILGNDWFITYTLREYELEITEWIATEKVENRFEQSIEMMNALKKILLLGEKKLIHSDMRHDTSYKFYRSLLNKGYIIEHRRELFIDYCAPNEIYRIIEELKSKYQISEFDDTISPEQIDQIIKQEIKIKPYESYILHHITFFLSEKFIKRYSNKNKKRVKNKKN